jgi:hypothetical protein
MNTLRWLRAVGDTVFAGGALAFVWFCIGLLRKGKRPSLISAEIPTYVGEAEAMAEE